MHGIYDQRGAQSGFEDQGWATPLVQHCYVYDVELRNTRVLCRDQKRPTLILPRPDTVGIHLPSKHGGTTVTYNPKTRESTIGGYRRF